MSKYRKKFFELKRKGHNVDFNGTRWIVKHAEGEIPISIEWSIGQIEDEIILYYTPLRKALTECE